HAPRFRPRIPRKLGATICPWLDPPHSLTGNRSAFGGNLSLSPRTMLDPPRYSQESSVTCCDQHSRADSEQRFASGRRVDRETLGRVRSAPANHATCPKYRRPKTLEAVASQPGTVLPMK